MPGTDDATTPEPAGAGHQEAQGEAEQQAEDPGRGSFRDAESWLAEMGVERDPLVVAPPDQDQRDAASTAPVQGPGRPATPSGAEGGGSDDGPEDGADRPPERLDDQVTEAITYARRATATTPLAEARLERKMSSRGYAPPVIEEAMRRARGQGLVDDHAFARSLVQEGRDKGHAPLRIKTDLQKRELSSEAIDAALDTIGDRDPEAQAFAVAHDRAKRLRGVDTETAYRRLVGYLARRGYTESLSRKVARQAVFDDREPQRVAEH